MNFETINGWQLLRSERGGPEPAFHSLTERLTMKPSLSIRGALSLLAMALASAASAQVVQSAPSPAAAPSSIECQAPLVHEAGDVVATMKKALAEQIPVEKAAAKAAVGRRLVAMGNADMDIRHIAMQTVHQCNVAFGSRGMAPIMLAGREINQATRSELLRILDSTGWPTISGYGAEADKAAFVITQHADKDLALQRRVLGMLEGLIAKGDTDKENYALLYDRVQVNEGRPQRYGTQGGCENGKWVSAKTEDEPGLAKRRASMKLPDLAEWSVTVAEMYCKKGPATLSSSK